MKLKSKIKKFYLIGLIFIGLFVFFVSIILAEETQNQMKLLTSWPSSPLGTGLGPESGITGLITYLYEWGIALGGIAAFIALLIAGFNYLTSTGNPEKIKESVERIKYALGGLILVLGSWLILNTINQQILVPSIDIIEPQVITPKTCTTDAECGANKFCLKEGGILRGIIRGSGIGLKEGKGICVQKEIDLTIKPCAFAMVWPADGFAGGDPIKINIGDHIPVGSTHVVKNVGSFKTFREKREGEPGTHDGNGNEVINGNYVKGGACRLQVAERIGGLFATRCRKTIENIPMDDTNFQVEDIYERIGDPDEGDRSITCIRLRK